MKTEKPRALISTYDWIATINGLLIERPLNEISHFWLQKKLKKFERNFLH